MTRLEIPPASLLGAALMYVLGPLAGCPFAAGVAATAAAVLALAAAVLAVV